MEFLATTADWFGRGGFAMYLLLLASIGAVAIILERARYFHAQASSARAFIAQLRMDMEGTRTADLAVQYSKGGRLLDRLVAAGFRAAARHRSVELAVEGEAQIEAAKLKKGLPLLGCLVTLAPILGLMGTVLGMIESFSVFNLQSGAPMAITGGVGEALVATVTGLGVATVALLGHSYFGYRVDAIVTDMEQVGTVLLDALSDPERKGKRGESHEVA